MSQRETMSTGAGSADIFDKYTLPKVALAVILAAALVGTWVSTSASGRSGLAYALATWVYFVALGIVTGGLVWKHGFVRPSDLGAGTSDYCAEMYARFHRITAGALVLLAVGGAVTFVAYYTRFGSTLAVLSFAAVGMALLVVLIGSARMDRSVADRFRSPAGLAALVLALALVVLTAVLEVSLRGFEPLAAVVRVLHFLAFAVWIGGAVWNIFVAVPTGQKRPSLPVVQAAGAQLERFRWAVRFIIPTLLLTGIYQAIDGFGVAVGTYLGTAAGIAILAKLGFIALLVVIFMLCPMWRACSPIDGVCDLEELDGSPDTETPTVVAGDD